MNILLEYHKPTKTHCLMDVIIDGWYAGTLKLRQEDVGVFDQIFALAVEHGSPLIDCFMTKGMSSLPEKKD